MSVEHLEFRLLKYIVAVADAGSFTAAAQRVHVSQSTLSTQIAALEDVLGILIFDREHGTKLTPEGKVLMRYAREGLKTRERIVQTVQAIHAGKMMPLRLGFTPFVQKALLNSVSEMYKDLLPECDLIPESGDTDEMTNRIREESLDTALVTLPVVEDGLEATVLERERLMVCMKNDDPLAAGEALPPLALNGKISIFAYQRNHPLAYERLVEMFNGLGITPRPCKPTMNIDHIQWMVKEGVCYSLMRASRPLMNGLVTRPIAGVDWTIDTAIVTKAESENPALAWFIEELTKHFRTRAEIPDKKLVASAPMREVAKKRANATDEDQLALFDGGGEKRHLRKLSPHRKEVLDE